MSYTLVIDGSKAHCQYPSELDVADDLIEMAGRGENGEYVVIAPNGQVEFSGQISDYMED